MRIQLPPPHGWEEFEYLALQLWKSIWADHNAQMHGRRGQPQCGVDIFGKPFGSSAWEGVQCKKRDRRAGAKLTNAELAAETAKAATFVPKLSAFMLATTSPRDAALQAEANRLSSLGAAAVRVSVWSWDDIEDELNFRDYLVPKLYPQFLKYDDGNYGRGAIENRLYFFRTQPLDRSLSIFSHPEIQRIFSSTMRVDIRNLVFELSLNAFGHGQATRVGVTVSQNGSLELVTDGPEHNPLGAEVSPSGVGLLYLKLFVEKYAGTFECTYSRTAENENRLTLSVVPGAKLNEPISARIVLFDDDALMPSRARYIARTAIIPTGYSTLELHIGAMVFSPSSLYEFLQELIVRLSPELKIRIFCGADDMFARLIDIWNSDSASELYGRFEIALNA